MSINFSQLEPNFCMENVIYNELRMRGYNVDVGVIATTEKKQEGKIVRKQLKVDFVCNLGSSRYYIQSAYSLPDETERSKIIRSFRISTIFFLIQKSFIDNRRNSWVLFLFLD